AGLVITALLPSCTKPKPLPAEIDPALSILIPPDTTMLLLVNIDALKKTSMYQKYLAPRNWTQLDDLAKFTGVDPRKDLWQILLLSDGKHSWMLARGDFQSDMETHLEKNGAHITMYKAYHLIGDDQASVVFFNTSAAALGNVDSLKALLDARGKAQGPP